MTNYTKQALLSAAALLTKAASNLEYGHNIEKEASATAEQIISRGMATDNQREFYKDYLAQHPDKIASIRNAFNDIPVVSTNSLGEVTMMSNDKASKLDPLDAAIFG